ncbi:MAG: OPT family oligopeptide transporter [Thermoguttaceae bacterium]
MNPSEETLSQTPADRQARRWLAEVYQGDKMSQLSVRSIVTGMLLGGVMSISNLYVGLKTGWGLGVTITACIVAYAVFRALEVVVPAYRKRPFTILENYTMSSAASAAGYMSSAGLVSAIPALYLATGRVLLWWEMMAWLAAISLLGVFMAIPLKRQLINIDQLPFPSGIATAETLRSMHTAGGEALAKARSLFAMAALGGLVAFWREGLGVLALCVRDTWAKFLAIITLPSEMPLGPGSWASQLLERYTVGFEGSAIMVAAGAIIGVRVGVSLLVGAVCFYGILAPLLDHYGLITELGYKGIVMWTVWPATAMMITASLVSLVLRWRTVLRALSGLETLLAGSGRRKDPLAHVEVPGTWFLLGTGASGLACVLLGWWMFDIAPWMGVLAVLLTFVLSIVAARATGETDITPIGAMGKITQLFYGVVGPHEAVSNMTTNLMTASITAGAASHSADLLTDLKSGYLLGGNPRKQTISQLFGVVAGTLFCVPVYAIVVRTPPVDPPAAAAPNPQSPIPPIGTIGNPSSQQTNLGTKEMPAPSAKVWAAMARVLAKGLDDLPAGAGWAMIVGGVLGLLLALGEELLPRRLAVWVPSATSLGIAGVIPAFNSISMFLGAFGAWLWMKVHRRSAEKYTIPGSSGLIAGESLMGVAVNLWAQGPAMISTILHQLWPR